MAKSHGRRSRMRSRRNKMRGGSYSSASTYGEYVNGSGDSQYSRVFDSNGSYGNIQSNTIIGTAGQGLQSSTQVPTTNQLELIQKAGGRRRKRGGFLGNVVNQAVVPMALFGLQQTYGRKRRVRNTHKHRTRRHRRH